MNCNEVLALLDAYFDKELSGEDDEKLTSHLSTCATCAEVLETMNVIKEKVGAEGRYQAPEGLRECIALALSDAADRKSEAGIQDRIPTHRVWMRLRRSRLAYVVPSIAAGLLVGWLAAPSFTTAVFEPSNLSQEIVSAHVRSQMADHLTDVSSSDRHRVKPWFSSRLGFSPPVVDLVDAGYGLLGGRIDYLDGRPVAALLYRHRRHVINLFVWNEEGAGFLPPGSRQGYNLLNWRSGDLTFWAISDLNVAELKDFRQLFRERELERPVN